jgi:hypothetical protein
MSNMLAVVEFVTTNSTVTTTIMIDSSADEDYIIDTAYEIVQEELRAEFGYDEARVLSTAPAPEFEVIP